MSYAAIAREEAAIVERTGLLGEGGAWAGRQMVARFFIEGFGTAEQRAAWLAHLASVAISEPRVGAHPKLLTTRAEEDADGYSIFGEKAWVTNGPLAAVFIVFAVTAIEDGRKRYSAFLVPRDTPGLSIDEAPQYRALAPSRHCGLKLDGCRVPRSALLGRPAPPTKRWRCRFAMSRTLSAPSACSAPSASCCRASQQLAAPATKRRVTRQARGADRGIRRNSRGGGRRARCWRTVAPAAALVGLRVLAPDMLQRAREYRDAFGPATDDAIERVFSDLDVSLSVARGPRQARQTRLGRRTDRRMRPCAV